MKFGSWTFDMSGISLYLDDRPLITDQYVNSSEWNLVTATKNRNVVKYACCDIPYVDVTFHMVLCVNLYITYLMSLPPCLVLVTTILFGFFLPPESGERISLTITILLAVAVFLQLISDALPRNSDSIPILAIFYMVVMAESAISLITTCVVLVIHYRSSTKGAAPMPKWVQKFFLGTCARLLGVRGVNPLSKVSKDNDDVRKSNIANKPKRNVEKKVSFGGVYGADDFSLNDNYGFTDDYVDGRSIDSGLSQMKYQNDALTDETKCFDGTLDSILHEVKIITKNMLNQHQDDELQEEWRFLAKVLDRLFFWLFLLSVILSATCLLVPVYLIHH